MTDDPRASSHDSARDDAGIDPHLRALDFHLILSMIAVEARTPPGREVVLSRRPDSRFESCERSQARLAEMGRFNHHEGKVPLSGLDGIVPSSGGLTLEEAWQALRSVQATQAVRESILRATRPYPSLRSIAERIPDLDEIVTEVSRYFTREGKLREDATPELRALRRKIQGKRQSVQKILHDLMRDHADAVQDEIVTLRADRYCIPVRSERRRDLPGILHERSGSGSTLFVEPMPIVEINNELAELLIAEREEILRIERRIAEIFEAESDRISEAIRLSAELDAIQACAIVGATMSACRPLFDPDGTLEIIDGRHPLLDERLRNLRKSLFGSDDDTTVVPQTIRIDRSMSGLVISGPNAGGKTVTLKTAGLLVAMAMSGLPVPAADGTTIPLVDGIRILIGDEQDVLEHLSTFSGYLRRLELVLRSATPDTFLLLDELGSGTDPEEGSALALAVIEHLLGANVPFIVTTHLLGVQTFAISNDRICNASMEFDPASGSPTFRMLPGLPGRSRAIEAAEKAGLPRSIIDRARAILGPDHAKADSMLAALQRATAEISAAREETLRSRDAAAAALETARALEEELTTEKRELARRWTRDASRIRNEIDRRLREEIEALRAADRTVREKSRAAAIAERVLEPAAELEDAASPAREPREGDRAEHRRFGVTGEIESVEGSRAVLVVSGRRMTVDLDDLLLVETPGKREPERRKATTRRPRVATADVEPEVDGEINLIGKRVDEALDEIDRYLDQALLAGKRAVRIIHGHGSGKLRAGVRDHLRTHAAVKSHRPGGEREGGDGATVAILDV